MDAGPDSGPPQPKCNDGIDNDGDGKVDYPNDPGCSAPNVDDEADDCPDGPNCPQCANGKDDDANSKTDYPDDPGCTSAADADEYTMNPIACGTNVMIRQLPVTGVVMDTFDATTSTFSQVSPCGGGDTNGVQVFAYELHLTEPKVIVASTMGSAIDTVLDIRSADCQAATSELACNDNDNGQYSKVVYSAQPGLYYILVENKVSTVTGDFKLEVQQLAGEGTECTDTSECGPGLLCRIPAGGSTMSCEKPVCDDGRDDDGDGKMDYPNDPGCDSPDDADETDDCPSGPNCPACGNGIDDDNDGQTDFPNDTACQSASGASEAACPGDMDNYGAITGPVSMGDLSMAHHDFTASCQSNTGNDASFIVDLPVPVSSLTADTNGSSIGDSVVTIWQGTCTTDLICDDDGGDGLLSMATATNLAAGTYAITVAGYSSSNNGQFTLNVHGAIVEGASCENTLNGVLACEPGTTCGGTMGSRTCLPAQCRDGIDNDGDGKMDYPQDPGCTTANDDDETDDCPSGPNCPACSNGVDDDSDGQTDYPNDPSCTAAGSTSESCTSVDDVIPLVTPTLAGTTVGAANDFLPSCGSSFTTTAPDQVFQITVPALTHLTIDAGTSFDAAISLLDSTCGGTSLQCNDYPENVDIGPLAAGTYYYIVDGWSSGSGTYNLTVTGTIAAGESCESPLATSGALTCESGTVCAGTMGSRTCTPPACADGIDNDGDGLIDNFDSGCDSATDADETDPATPPVCANGMDDDTDGTMDFPGDLGCARAGGTTEAFCPTETDALVVVANPTTTVDLTNSSHTTTLACQGNTDHDWTLGLSLPVRVASLTIDTEGSTATDTVVELMDPQCTTSAGCDDDNGSGNLSSLTLANVAAGNYAIVVAGYSTTHNQPVNVNVHGTLASGTRCDSPLVTSGVLACAGGLTCTGSPATCQ